MLDSTHWPPVTGHSPFPHLRFFCFPLLNRITLMKLDSNTIAEAAQRIGIKPEELAAVLKRGTAVTYKGGDYLFHESTPRSGWGWSSKARLTSCAASTGKACSSAWRNPAQSSAKASCSTTRRTALPP